MQGKREIIQMAVNFDSHVRTLTQATAEYTREHTGVSLTREQVLQGIMNSENIETAGSNIALALSERHWHTSGRPFFNVYPSVLNALKNTTLQIDPKDIPESIVHELGAICVKFPIGFQHPMKLDARSFMLVVSERTIVKGSVVPVKSVGVSVGLNDFDVVLSMSCQYGKVFENCEAGSPSGLGYTDDEHEIRKYISRIGLGVLMLAADPDFLKPIVLKKFGNVEHPTSDQIDKSKRRGVFGFSIGESIEVAPHIRRPHFAIRWTGKGREVPRLVPVKGSLIHRNKMTTVPTGFEASLN